MLFAIEVQHHYWDWVEDFGMQKEIILLSPKGEGVFSVERALKKPPTSRDFVIVYGLPVLTENKKLSLTQATIRIFPPQSYTTEAMVYGRPGGVIEVIDTQPSFKVIPPQQKKESC